MTKKVEKEVADLLGITQVGAKRITNKVIEAIVARLIKDGRVDLWGFGVFKIQILKARKARNPRTGETINVPARLRVSFKASKALEGVVSDLVSRADVEE